MNKLMLFFANKKYFPFNAGVNRLLIVLWIIMSACVEIFNWKFRGAGIENYATGFIPLSLGVILYFAFIWVYNGFKNSDLKGEK